jgi:hypothetical protein
VVTADLPEEVFIESAPTTISSGEKKGVRGRNLLHLGRKAARFRASQREMGKSRRISVGDDWAGRNKEGSQLRRELRALEG